MFRFRKWTKHKYWIPLLTIQYLLFEYLNSSNISAKHWFVWWHPLMLGAEILFRISWAGPGLGWEGHWVTPVKVRVKSTQTAVRADSHGIEIASHRWGDAWENILIGSKIISPWLLTSRIESKSTVSLGAVLAAANIFSNLDKCTSVHIYQVLGTDTLTAIIMERVYA